jgi:hypothetical protein
VHFSVYPFYLMASRWSEHLSCFPFRRPRTQNPAQVSLILTDVFRDAPKCLQETILTLPQVRPQPHPSTSCTIHYLLIIIFDTVLSELHRTSSSSGLNSGVPDSHVDPEPGYPDRVFSWFSPVPVGKCRYSTSR